MNLFSLSAFLLCVLMGLLSNPPTGALAECPGSVPEVVAAMSLYMRGSMVPYDWVVSPLAMSGTAPSGDRWSSANCPTSNCYVSQFAQGGECQKCFTQLRGSPTVDGEGCRYMFTDGGATSATISMQCDKAQTSGVRLDTTASGTVNMGTTNYEINAFWYGVCPGATPAPGPNGGGGGSSGCGGGCVFVIVFFVGAFLYVAGTVAYNYQRLGKRGKELAPHPEFWLMIPGLIKDGVVVTFRAVTSPCRNGGGSTSGSTYTQV